MIQLRWINLGLRGLMEAGIVLAFAYWGFKTGETTGSKVFLAIFVPLIVFGFWGTIDFHQFGKFSEILRLIQDILISGLAAIVLYLGGAHIWGWALAILSFVHHVLAYLIGDSLIKQ